MRLHYDDYGLAKSEDVGTLIEHACDGSDYDSGAVETNAASCSKLAEVLGRLVDRLAKRGVLDADDVVCIADLYRRGGESPRLE